MNYVHINQLCIKFKSPSIIGEEKKRGVQIKKRQHSEPRDIANVTDYKRRDPHRLASKSPCRNPGLNSNP